MAAKSWGRASTEPHSCECGEEEDEEEDKSFHNLLQRSRTRVSAERIARVVSNLLYGKLQRSRTRVSAESIVKLHGTPGQHRYASTEPHSCECGEQLPTDVTDWVRKASTEPHSCECGEIAALACLDALPAWLQRSRTRVSAERRACQSRHESAVAASTEPHSCECGERSKSVEFLPHLRGASTEPHSCECGEQDAGATHVLLLCQLQRSRTRVSAERDDQAYVSTLLRELQRSRTRVSAERASYKPDEFRLLAGFNGAALV